MPRVAIAAGSEPAFLSANERSVFHPETPAGEDAWPFYQDAETPDVPSQTRHDICLYRSVPAEESPRGGRGETPLNPLL